MELALALVTGVLMCYALFKPLESMLLQLLISGLIPRCSMPFQCKVGGSFQYRNIFCVKASSREKNFRAQKLNDTNE